MVFFTFCNFTIGADSRNASQLLTKINCWHSDITRRDRILSSFWESITSPFFYILKHIQQKMWSSQYFPIVQSTRIYTLLNWQFCPQMHLQKKKIAALHYL